VDAEVQDLIEDKALSASKQLFPRSGLVLHACAAAAAALVCVSCNTRFPRLLRAQMENSEPLCPDPLFTAPGTGPGWPRAQ